MFTLTYIQTDYLNHYVWVRVNYTNNPIDFYYSTSDNISRSVLKVIDLPGLSCNSCLGEFVGMKAASLVEVATLGIMHSP